MHWQEAQLALGIPMLVAQYVAVYCCVAGAFVGLVTWLWRR